MNNISTSTKILSIAVVLIVVGYLLMAGPGSTDQQFNPGIFSTRRIVVAPALCLAGYLLIIVGIIKKKK
jgi:NhaP-type Na+/H+ or K+/H+ antiporter